jgi:DNA-binding NtrC family response regulator
MSTDDDGRTKPQQHPQGQQTVRQVRIEVVEGPDEGKVFDPAKDVISIGTSENNDVVLSDPTISRYHVELHRAVKGIEVKDLGSLNGTFTAKIRIEHAVVSAGARLRLGSTVLRLEDGDPLSRPDADVSDLPGLVGRSEAMRDVAAMVRRLAGSEVSVLIEGETGTGKEVVARAIHQLGSRSSGPFEVVDCGSLPATLIASQLFGHERGAFTGAERRQIGAFERASGGTLFLDEVGELPLSVQPVLLGVLERRRFRRLGGDHDLSLDLRLLAATNRDLRAEANAGTFRADLYYRLATTRIHIPPLRERREDIEPLVVHFVEEATGSREEGCFGPQAMASLTAHRWSGNVRELRNVIESTLAMGRLDLDLPREEQPARKDDPEEPVQPYREARAQAIARFEETYLGDLMRRCADNASKAARRAKMDRPYLLSLLRRHGLR